jgi:hypothetical protein
MAGGEPSKTLVKDGRVKNIKSVLSLVEDTKKDIVQLRDIARSVVRVGPAGPLNPALSTDIVFRLTNQVRPNWDLVPFLASKFIWLALVVFDESYRLV